MRRKRAHLVMSFHTTNEAMAMRQASTTYGLHGRLIPIPRQLSAGCGLAWSEPAENEATLLHAVEDCPLEYEQIVTMDL